MSSSSSFQPLMAPAKKPDFTPLRPEQPTDAEQFEPLFGTPSPESSEPEPEPEATLPESETPDVGADEESNVEPELEPELSQARTQPNESDEADETTSEPASSSEQHDTDAELSRLSEEAREIGRQAGHQEGLDAAAGAVQAAEALLEELTTLRRSLLERSVKDVADAARLVAHRIVRRELLVAPGDVQALVQDVLSAVGEEDEILLVVAPEDDLALRDAYPSLLRQVGHDASLRIETSADIARGGVKVETMHGNVDATIEARFEAFADSIDAWAKERVESLDA